LRALAERIDCKAVVALLALAERVDFRQLFALLVLDAFCALVARLLFALLVVCKAVVCFSCAC
jgi:hypothetical protein